MNTRCLFIGPLAFVATMIPAPVRGAVPQSELQPRTVLTRIGGAQVIHRSTDHDIAVVRLFLLGGVRQVTERTAGIEALALRAAEFEAQRAVAGAGCRLSLDPGLDWTVVGFTCLDRDVDAGWDALAQLLRAENLTESSVKRAREELLSAARRRNSHPDLHVNAMAMRNAFSDHPYSAYVHGFGARHRVSSRAGRRRSPAALCSGTHDDSWSRIALDRGVSRTNRIHDHASR